MANGKLAKYAEKNGHLRRENRELRAELEDSQPNPSTLRQAIGVGIKNGAAYGVGRGFIKMQQKGWMPQKVPVDLIAGTAGQILTAFFHGPIAGIFRDVSDGTAEGSLGRLAAYHQLEKSEVEGRQALLLPAPAAP